MRVVSQRGLEGAALDPENPAQRAEPCGGRYETPLNETSSAPCDSAGVWLSHPRNCSSLNLSVAVAARLMSLAAHRWWTCAPRGIYLHGCTTPLHAHPDPHTLIRHNREHRGRGRSKRELSFLFLDYFTPSADDVGVAADTGSLYLQLCLHLEFFSTYTREISALIPLFRFLSSFSFVRAPGTWENSKPDISCLATEI